MCGVASVASFPVKNHHNPKPSTIPEICYNPIAFGWNECYRPQECCCKLSFFGLVCLWSSCCDSAAEVMPLIAES